MKFVLCTYFKVKQTNTKNTSTLLLEPPYKCAHKMSRAKKGSNFKYNDSALALLELLLYNHGKTSFR